MRIGNSGMSNLISAKLSWRPVTMQLLKKFHYSLSWSSDDCDEDSKPLRARTPVSIVNYFRVGYY